MTKGRQSIGRELNGSTELRLHNQLTRAFTNSFGAEQGLHELVKLATIQMLAAGTSRAAIRSALMRVVNDHAAFASGRVRGATLSDMMLEWSDCTEAGELKNRHDGGHQSGHNGQ
jgi:hypothetical protein